MRCVCCGAGIAVGALCRSCAQSVSTGDGMIAEHIRSTVDASGAHAWIVDGFGGAHPIGARSTIGRGVNCDLVVLARSVSREHAELHGGADGWRVRDLGSRNGTFVGSERCHGESALPPRARLTIGDVALWFIVALGHTPPLRPPMATGGVGHGLTCYQLVHRHIELCIFAGDDATAGGALLWRAAGDTTWSERGLAPLELQLLRMLCARCYAEAGAPARIRGCVPTKQLARELPFQSKYANQDNVRQIVLRLRATLVEIGVRGLLAVAPGRGYYLACSVTTSSSGPGHTAAPRPSHADRAVADLAMLPARRS